MAEALQNKPTARCKRLVHVPKSLLPVSAQQNFPMVVDPHFQEFWIKWVFAGIPKCRYF